jgi:hypothetical protein
VIIEGLLDIALPLSSASKSGDLGQLFRVFGGERLKPISRAAAHLRVPSAFATGHNVDYPV